jgi:hypothetical protein
MVAFTQTVFLLILLSYVELGENIISVLLLLYIICIYLFGASAEYYFLSYLAR